MPAVYSGDLRSEAKDILRDKNHTSKWSRGVVQRPAAKCSHGPSLTCDTCAILPRKAENIAWTRVGNVWQGPKAHAPHMNTIARKVLHKEVVDALDEDASDSSASDEVNEASAAPDADVMYSYDAYNGPGRGSQILSYALNQAVQRFENNETDKIVKEYDLVLDGKDELHFADAEDDFEVIDAAQLN